MQTSKLSEEKKEYQRNYARERSREHYKNNPEKVKEASRKWYKENPERAKETLRKWIEENPEKMKEAQRKLKEKNPNYHKEQYEKNKELNREKYILRVRKIQEETPWIPAYRRTRYRARKNGMEFKLTEEYLKSIWTSTCPVFEIPLFVANSEDNIKRSEERYGACDNSPSVDRIDSSKGYIIGNVRIISQLANQIKNCGTADQHEAIARYMHSCNKETV